MGYAPLELDPLVLPLVEGKTMLDLGCGFGHWGHLLRTHYYSEDPGRAAHITGVDIHDGNVAFCGTTGVYDELVTGDVLDFLAQQKTAAFDTVLAIELIEHLPKEAGGRLLDEMTRVAVRVLIVSTPNWKYLRDGRMSMTGYNEHEHHLSHWTAAELRRRGLTVRGVGHRVRSWPVRGINRLLDTFPTLDLTLAAWTPHHPALSKFLLAYRRV